MFDARPAADDDVPAILTMMADFNAIEAIPFDRDAFAPRVRELIASPHIGGILAFRFGEEIVGYAIVTYGWDLEFAGRDAFLTELYIAGTWRRRGLGREGLAAAERYAKAGGAHALHLLVRHDNAAARLLYDDAGYKTQPRLVMSKLLG